MKKLLSVILVIAMLFSITTVAFADDGFVSSGVREVEGIIKVGVNAEFAPFEYMEKDKLMGFDIDLMNYISGRIGYGIEFVNLPFDSLIPAVLSGRVDCAISAVTITEEREEQIDFTTPYLVKYERTALEPQKNIKTEKYAIVFGSGLAQAFNSGSVKTDDEKLFELFELAIGGMIQDGTIYKLIEKYKLNDIFDENGIDYEYSTATKYVIDANEPSEWAKASVDTANDIGITYRTNRYLYKKDITREAFCELVYNLIKAVLNKSYTIDTSFKFNDTDSEAVLVLNSLGIIKGKTETEFAPDDNLTREEAAVIIMRMINNLMPMAMTEMLFVYEDINEISDWAADDVQKISNLGFMQGVGNGKFAPKATYKTEQAIATLVRVYERTKASEITDSTLGIIGGADGPTQIIIGEGEASEEFEVTKTTKIDDFYIDEAVKLVVEAGELAGDKELIKHYTVNEEMTDKILELGAVDYSKPSQIYYMAADEEQIINNIKALSNGEAEGIDIEKLLKLNKVDFSVIGNLINSSYGSEAVAAMVILNNSRGYIKPEDFEKDFALYMEYDEGCSALVSFSEFGEGVIKANMSFVINGDKDNIFRRLYEIKQGLGEDSITVAKVEF